MTIFHITITRQREDGFDEGIALSETIEAGSVAHAVEKLHEISQGRIRALAQAMAETVAKVAE